MKATKELIRDTFVKLLQNNSSKRINVKDIALAANIHRITFYTHFRTIDDLVAWIFIDYFKTHFKIKDLETWNQVFNELVRVINKYKAYLQLLFKSRYRTEAIRFIFQTIRLSQIKRISLICQQKQLSKNQISAMASFFTSGAVQIVVEYIDDELKVSKEEMVDVLKFLIDDYSTSLIEGIAKQNISNIPKTLPFPTTNIPKGK
jgi:AcrR family transcriptional regulator